MPRVPIDPRTLRPVQPKMKKRRIGWIITSAVLLAIISGFAINYIIYANRMQTYDLYLKSPDFCQEVVDAFAAKADSEDAIKIAAYTNAASYDLGTGNQVDVMHSGGTEKDMKSYDYYKGFFNSKTTSNIKKVFRTSISQIIMFQRDTANNLYTVEFIEETNVIGFNMILAYVSQPLGDLQAARDYFGNDGKKVYQMMSDHWYYVQDLGI